MADGDHVVEVPGEGRLVFRPAGPGTRMIAALIDHLLVATFLLVLSLVALSAVPLPPFSRPTLIAWVLTYLAYFTLLEWRRGRTLGKAILGLRVIGVDGRGLDIPGALIRNIFRLVDVLPTGYLLGVFTMSVDRHARRLGDLVGGTMVVRDAAADPPYRLLLRLPFRKRPTFPSSVLERITLTPAEYQVLRSFCFRTRSLTPAARQRLGTGILAPLYARAGLPLPPADGIEELLVDLLHRENDTFGAESLVTEPLELYTGLSAAPPAPRRS